MKVLLLNQDWFAHELREAGHEVLSCGLATHLDVVLPAPMIHIDTILKELCNSFTPDLVIWLDNSAPSMICGLEEIDVPVLFYSVDTHHHAELHTYIAPSYEHMFVAQRDYLPHLESHGVKCSWLPLWASRDVAASSEKRWEVSFVGTMSRALNPLRVDFFDAMSKKIPIHLAHGEYWKIFPHSEIVMNQTVKGDLNFRVFEAMMCGSLLLTERTNNGLLDIFEDGVHLVTYERNSPDDAAEKALKLLADKSRMRSIAHAGRELVCAKHRAANRLETILDVVRNTSRTAISSDRYYAALVNYAVVATILEKKDTGVYAKALIAALRAAEMALSLGGQPKEIHCVQLIIAAIHYDRLTCSGGGQRMLSRYAEAFPHMNVLNLALIRALLNSGAREAAAELAGQISTKPPAETFASAEELVTLILTMTD